MPSNESINTPLAARCLLIAAESGTTPIDHGFSATLFRKKINLRGLLQNSDHLAAGASEQLSDLAT